MSTNKILFKGEIIPYEEYKITEFSDIVYNIFAYCQDNSPCLLKYGQTNELIEILCAAMDFQNPFILVEDNLASEDDDDYEEM